MTLSLKPSLKWSPLQRYLELLYILVERNLKGRYRGSFLGVYWSLLNPLLMTGVYTAIFGAEFARFFNNSLLKYILAAFTGLVVINFFSAATSQALGSVVGNGSLLNKIRLPISIFPVSMIVANIFQFMVGSMPLLMLVTLLTCHRHLGYALVNIPSLILPLVGLSLVSAGVGFLLSALYVFFRDLPYFYELVVFVLWIGSPVFYPSEIVPEKVKAFLVVNPLLPIIDSIRQISLSGELPNFWLVGHSLINGVVIFMIGWICFRAWQNQFMDLL